MSHYYTIPYGAETLSFSLPEHSTVEIARPPKVAPAPDPAFEIRQALDSPIGCLPLERMIKPGQRVCIISDDITRPTPCKTILEELLPRIHKAGVPEEDVFIVMALGSHRPMTHEEIVQKLGSEIAARYRVVNSEFERDEGLLDLGKSPTGATVRVSRNVMESDIRIGLGNIVPHPAMGWSGGAKILYPGVTSEDTVVQFHMLQGLAEEVLFGMDECYVRLEVEQWADVIGLHYIVNTVMTPDLALYKAVAGHPIAAHRQGVAYAKEACGVKLEEPADVIVVSSYPVDIDYWQATKGYLCAARGAKEGASIVLATPCPEGVGPHPEYVQHVGDDNAREKLLRLQRGEPIEGDRLALSVGACVSRIRQMYQLITVGDGLTAEELGRARIRHYPKAQLQQAVTDACAGYQNPRVLIITHGGETVVY